MKSRPNRIFSEVIRECQECNKINCESRIEYGSADYTNLYDPELGYCAPPFDCPLPIEEKTSLLNHNYGEITTT